SRRAGPVRRSRRADPEQSRRRRQAWLRLAAGHRGIRRRDAGARHAVRRDRAAGTARDDQGAGRRPAQAALPADRGGSHRAARISASRACGRRSRFAPFGGDMNGIRNRFLTFLLGLYPRWWRERYGDEFTDLVGALVDDRRRDTLSLAFDLTA